MLPPFHAGQVNHLAVGFDPHIVCDCPATPHVLDASSHKNSATSLSADSTYTFTNDGAAVTAEITFPSNVPTTAVPR